LLHSDVDFYASAFIVYCLQRQHVSAITAENWISFPAEKLSRWLEGFSVWVSLFGR